MSEELLYGMPTSKIEKIIGRALSALDRAERQSILSELENQMAVPPRGHSCPDCNRPGELYCLTVAVQRARGLRKD